MDRNQNEPQSTYSSSAYTEGYIHGKDGVPYNNLYEYDSEYWQSYYQGFTDGEFDRFIEYKNWSGN